MTRREVLHYSDILEWADEYRARKGVFSTAKSGRVAGLREEKWSNLDAALRVGLRGFPGGSSLARLLAKKRGYRNRKGLPKYTLVKILKWADAHHRRTGRWPNRKSGSIQDARGETWQAVENALCHGIRGLRGDSSLAQLLAARRGVRNHTDLPNLSVERILRWADAHKTRTGQWPKIESVPIEESSEDTWVAVDHALNKGSRGLLGGSSLFRLLAARRGVRRHVRKPPLSIDQILAWADAHQRRMGKWPSEFSGSIVGAADETWSRVQTALKQGKRGLPGKSTLSKLLAERRGVRNIQALPKHTTSKILKWADAHHHRIGVWPTRESGSIPGAPGESWQAIEVALQHGNRGLSGNSSIARLLAKHRGVPNRLDRPSFSVQRILRWADAHQARTGNWPQAESGLVQESPRDTWLAINHALSRGTRGLSGGSSLFKLLHKHRGILVHRHDPPLSVPQILRWADAYKRRTARWPNQNSGPIPEAPGETWGRVQCALKGAKRNLAKKTTLIKLLAEHRGVRNEKDLPPYTLDGIRKWIREYYRAHGKYPNHKSGPILNSGGETWLRVDAALRVGVRGLPGGSSVYRLIQNSQTKP